MKITQTHLRIVLLCLAGILILFGLLKLAFGINFGKVIEENIGNVVMIGAAAIFVWNRSLWNKEKKLRDEEEAQRKAAEETAAEEGAVTKAEAPDPKG